jgi:hypothetical protein
LGTTLGIQVVARCGTMVNDDVRCYTYLVPLGVVRTRKYSITVVNDSQRYLNVDDHLSVFDDDALVASC